MSDAPRTQPAAPSRSRRSQLVALLAAAQALDSLDRGSLGAMAPSLEAGLEFSNTQLGLLLAIVSVTSAIATMGAGILVDSRRRTRLLAWSLILWAAAMGAGALAPTYAFLLVSRIALGVVIASVGPASASLVGDLYRGDERGRIIGWIRTGEYLGVGLAFLIVSAVGWALSWRAVFALLALIGAFVAFRMWQVDEPSRRSDHQGQSHEPDVIEELIEDEGVEPAENAVVLPGGSASLTVTQVVRYAIDVPTNRMLLVAETIGDFALSGVATFAVLFAVAQFDISQSLAAALLPIAGVGALLGVMSGSHFGDWLIRTRHVLTGRLWVAGFGYFLAGAFLVPVLFVRSWYIALPFLAVAGAGLGASGPTVSAARLDVIVGTLWGRVEAVRTLLRAGALAAAPLLGGYLSDHLAGGGRAGLRFTMAFALPLLAINGALVLVARRSYASDIAAAQRSGEGRSCNGEDPQFYGHTP